MVQMTDENERVQHVSDTALIVTAVRAIETGRRGGWIHDPFAERLAGRRGMALARSVPGFEWMCFGIGMRCHFMDELFLMAARMPDLVAVVTLGAGLDTRPWRLDLPPALRWLEVDLPAILDYKSAALTADPPSCQVERLVADLNDPSQRHAVFSAAGPEPGLMVTEGLLMYLPPETLQALASEAFRRSGVRYWLLDVASPDLMRRAHRDSQDIENMRPSGYLKGAQILELAERNGWRPIAQRNYTRDGWDAAADRIRQLPDGETMADDRHRPTEGDPSGVYLFGR
jgi:methyltransferase (TIGR00027 family)